MAKEIKNYLKDREEKNQALRFVALMVLALLGFSGFVWLVWFFVLSA